MDDAGALLYAPAFFFVDDACSGWHYLDMDKQAYLVSAERIETFKKAIADFTKKMARLATRKGVQFTPPVVTVDPTPVIKKGRVNEFTGHKEPDWVGYNVAVESEVAKVPGYEFVASLEHVEDVGTIVRAVPSATIAENELAEFRKATPACHHCGYARVRKDTFVVRREADKALLQIGRNCLKDFLGHDAQWIAQLMAMKLAIDEIGREAEEGSIGGGVRTHYSIREFLPWVFSCIRVDGWTSRTKARELQGLTATADRALPFAFPSPTMSAQMAKERREREPNETDCKLAEEALQFAHDRFDEADLATLSDYESNLAVVILSEVVDYRKAGIAASLATYYNRELAKRAETMKDADSQYFGTIGKREVFVLTLQKAWERSTMYGAQTIYKFKDEKGNIATWFASTTGKDRLEIGATYKVKATVKKHEEFRGAKQTVITRAATELVPPKPA